MSNHASDSSGQPSAPDWDAIARFLAGESAPDEAASVQRWLDANPDDRALVERLNTSAELAPVDVDTEAALARMHKLMKQPEGKPRLTVDRGGAPADAQRRRYMAFATMAAAAAVVIITSLSIDRTPPAPADGAEIPGHTYVTPVGQRDSVALSDGSRVMLGPDSRLSVLPNYGVGHRAVELVGDAYFDVKHDPKTSFTVVVNHAIVEDIGTTFAIESDAGDTTTVSVITGSVRLRPKSGVETSGAVLAAGDRGSMAPDGRVQTFPHTVADDAAWTTGRLVFNEASLARVTGEIRRWYGVEITVADTALLSKHVTTSFNQTDPIDQVLKIIGLTLGASVDRQGGRATLSSMHGGPTVK